MPKLFRTIAAAVAVLILLTGCSPQPVDQPTSESPTIQFVPQTTPTTESATDPSPDMTEESSSETTEANSSEESTEDTAPEETSPEETTPEETTPEETTPEETTPEETTPEETTPEETTPEETTRPVIEFTPVEETVYATDFVNLRTDYSLDADIVLLLGPGNSITRIGYHEEWSKILFKGEVCYISSKYVTTVAPPTEPPTEAPTEAPPVVPAITAPEFEIPFYINLSNVIFTGRWFSKDISGNSYATVNAGSEFSFRTEGASYAFIYINGNGDGDFYYAYSVDGQGPVRQHISNRVVPLGGAGTHTVRIIIDSLGERGSRWDESIAIGVRGVSTDAGTISPWHHTSSTIAFFGDSITDGIRTLSSSSHSYTNSYVWYCSQAMGALPIVCGFPGSGVTTEGTFNTCINAIQYYSSSKGAETFSPSVIVLNHGTNDVDVDSAAFIAAYNATLDTLHAKYPHTKIACVIPVSQIHADDIRNCVAGKDWCAVVETSDWGVSYTDGIHPDAASGYSMGNNLANALRALIG